MTQFSTEDLGIGFNRIENRLLGITRVGEELCVFAVIAVQSQRKRRSTA
jgi:hypothetical protein